MESRRDGRKRRLLPQKNFWLCIHVCTWVECINASLYKKKSSISWACWMGLDVWMSLWLSRENGSIWRHTLYIHPWPQTAGIGLDSYTTSSFRLLITRDLVRNYQVRTGGGEGTTPETTTVVVQKLASRKRTLMITITITIIGFPRERK